ncbi:MAG: fructose-6-phosphate aldolase [Myxococcota bacterium]|nr:fructose-6-phosphate aldolase [Myxococcota bacterium]
MKIFLDTANFEEIKAAHELGVLDGVTTNPSLIAREGGDFIQTFYDICELVQGPVSAETVSQDVEGMVREGELLAKIHEHIVVKVPLTRNGLAATKRLSDQGIKVNVTLCFQASQALLAAKAGAAYISPFLGRLDDISHDGVGLIEEIAVIYANYSYQTEILAASIRHPKHFVEVALAGADVATIPANVFNKLLSHPLTDSGNERFLSDWDKVPNNNIEEQVKAWLEANQK